MDKIIKKTIIGVMLCVACITICACNGKEKIRTGYTDSRIGVIIIHRVFPIPFSKIIKERELFL